MEKQSSQGDNWTKLDNAGKLYPSLVSSKNTTLFRISARLKRVVKANLLQQALEALVPRFPYYHVHLQRGAFWYFFIPQQSFPKVEKDSRYPCMKMAIRQRGRFPFRVRAFKYKISVEFSHILTDGTGALLYFETLLAEYLRLREGLDQPFEGIINPNDPVDPEEGEDAFHRYYEKGLPHPPNESKAFKIQDKPEKRGIYHVTTGLVDVDQLKTLAKKYGLSITGFLTSVIIEVLQDHLFSLPPKKQRRRAGPIRVCLPINLRPFFPSITMRNFFLSLNPSIDPRMGRYTFQEICNQVGHFMASQINTKVLKQQISRNIRSEKTLAVRLIPSWIKDMIIPGIYKYFGESAYSTVLSNLGNLKFPAKIQQHIHSIEFVPNPPEGTTRVKMGVISLAGKMTITFGRISRRSLVERNFFRKLIKMGIAVKIDSNIWQDDPEKPVPWIDLDSPRS
ncbi:MAG: hypothetical protein PF447_04800 [Spirochaetaceae bacterium]|jgi:hypothetical protein|nr:hypothetical protein [Spirochaetaceae bacterium]